MLRISLELDGASVTRLGDDTAACRAFAACSCVIRRHAGDGLVGRDQIRNQLLYFFGAAPKHRGARSAGSENLEEVAALYAGRTLIAHVSSGTSRNRSSRGKADSTGRCGSSRTNPC